MFSCIHCDKLFSTKHSLASHRYSYHKDMSTSNPNIVDDTVSESSDEADQLGSTSGDSDAGTINESTDADDEKSIEEDSTEKRQHNAPKIQRKNKAKSRRYHPYQSNMVEVDKKLDEIIEKLDSTRRISNQITTNNAINYPTLIQSLCKGILDGSIPLSKLYIDALKPKKAIVRKMAHGKIATTKRLILKDLQEQHQTGSSALKPVLDGTINCLRDIFNN